MYVLYSGLLGLRDDRWSESAKDSPASADSLWVSPDINRVHSKFSTIPLSTLYIKVWNLVLRYQHGYIDTRPVVLASRSSHLAMATRRDLGVIY
jgi:hypothetical protein